MCGIMFVLTQDTFAHNTDKFMKDAFITNMVRGRHSSGVFQIDSKREITLHKKAMDGARFITEPGVDTLLNAVPRSIATVGHVRHATQGTVNDANAHPFLITRENGSKLIGVHNGSLRNWAGHNKDKVDVDSAWALQKIAEEGEDAFQYFDGPFAFVWYDTEFPDHIFMTRNDDRPLHFMLSKDKKTMIGASELGMLGWLAERNKIIGAEKPDDRFKYLEPTKLYRFSLKNIGEVDFWDRQKYDPRTNITPVRTGIVHGATSLHPAQRGGMYHDSGWVEGDDWERGDDGMYHYQGQGRYSPPGWLPTRGRRETQIMDDARDVLMLASYAADTEEADENYVQQDSEFVEDGVTEGDMKLAVEEWIKKQNPKLDKIVASSRWAELLCKNPVFLGSPNDASAKTKEIERVQRLAMYGKVGYFTGVLFEEDEKECWGEFVTYDRSAPITADAVVRAVTKRVSDARYINSNQPRLMTIIGLTEPDGGTPAMFVLAELRKDELSKVTSRLDQLAAVN